MRPKHCKASTGVYRPDDGHQQSNPKNKMTIPEQLAHAAFAHRNWTKLTLEELIMCGRILRSDDETLMDFVNAANGYAENLETLENYKKAIQIIKTL